MPRARPTPRRKRQTRLRTSCLRAQWPTSATGASQAVKVLTDPTVTEYLDAIHNGAKGDATTLDNMIEALKFIQEANQLRAKEGLQPLKVSDTLMAQAWRMRIMPTTT